MTQPGSVSGASIAFSSCGRRSVDPDDAILLELRALHRKVDALMAAQRVGDVAAEAFCAAVLEHHGTTPFTAAQLRDDALVRSTRRPLLIALRELCRTGDSTPSEHQIGIALGNLARSSGVVVGRKTRYGREWSIVPMSVTTGTALSGTIGAP